MNLNAVLVTFAVAVGMLAEVVAAQDTSPTLPSPVAPPANLVRDAREHRVLGLPVSAALVIGGVLVALFVVAGVAILAARRRDRARGNGAYR